MHLEEADWRARMAAHEQRVDPLVEAHLARRSRGQPHPIEDFLFEYYPFRAAHLRKWHPGCGVTLLGDPPHVAWVGYVRTAHGVTLDPALLTKRLPTVRWVADLLRATASRPAFTGCFGLHEWAMLYRARRGEVRHESLPLRLGRAGTDDVVEAHQIRCTHFDAFRFFTPDARRLNALEPSREQQVDLEQPGCLHANMDLYKWAGKLSPLINSELLVDTFVLAREIRVVDMQASPYDVSSLGYGPIPIETREGKAEYVAAQREFAERSTPIRAQLIAECARLLAV